MSADWPVVPLATLVTVKGGKRLPKEDSLQAVPTPHPYIRVRDMGQRFLPENGLEYVPINVFPKIKRYIVEENDVIISIVGTIGLISLVDKRFHLASQTENSAKLTGLDRIDSHYLYYYLTSNLGQNHIKQATIGAVQAKLPLYNIEKIPVVWPERTDRGIIVKQLGTIDDKIELNRQINQTLEHIAQTIFKSWFVDFEPVKAKIKAKAAGRDPERAAMCAISGKLEPELDQLSPEQYQQFAATATLFPEELVESELGLIPKGWKEQRLDNILDLSYGKSLTKTDRKDGNFPVYGSGGVTGYHSNPLVAGPGIIIGRKGTVGSLYWEDKDFFPIDTVFFVEAKNGSTLEFLFYLLQTLGLEKMNTDAAVPGLNRNNVYRIQVPCCPDSVIQEFTKTITLLKKKISTGLDENMTLTTIRDNLIPRLLSGEIPINTES